MRRCLHCERPAEVSLCAVISTLGIRGRRQKCTASLPFCVSCLQRVCAKSEGSLALQIRKALKTALYALTEQRLREMTPNKHLDEKDYGLETEELS